MALHLLLFSSDEKTALALRQVLAELDFEVDHCPEIFASDEKLTRQNFDVIVVDWDDEPEASFLLKSARELKSSKQSLALAILPSGVAVANALQIGAHGTLTKPIVPSQATDTLRTIRELLIASRSSASERHSHSANTEQVVRAYNQEFIAIATNLLRDPPVQFANGATQMPADNESEELFPPTLRHPSEFERCTGALFSSLPYGPDSSAKSQSDSSFPKRHTRFANSVAVLGAALFAAALLYVFAPGSSYFDKHSSATASRSGTTGKAGQPQAANSGPKVANGPPVEGQLVPPQTANDRGPALAVSEEPPVKLSGHIQVIPVAHSSAIANVRATNRSQPSSSISFSSPSFSKSSPVPSDSSASTATIRSETQVPESLRVSFPTFPFSVSNSNSTAALPGSFRPILLPEEAQLLASKLTPAHPSSPVRASNPSPAPSVWSSFHPVMLPEEVLGEVLVNKVQPIYPQQALRAGLQGAVVLQAWIARDGSIRDLKLIRGYLVLGRAAFDAVKQWRFKPYYLNGQAVETQTLITVNFRPPS